MIVNGRDQARGEATVAEIQAAGGTAHFIAADLSDIEKVRLLATRAREIGGGHVDILVNNAGLAPFGPSTAVTITRSTPSSRST